MSVKYPRTFHLPWSPGASSDDKIMGSVAGLAECGDLVVTEKMDGGNFTMTSEGCYARSPSANHQPWDGPARAVWASVARDLPPGWRFCGESVHARRSVAYDDLPGPFLLFAVFNDDDVLLSWDDTVMYAGVVGLPLVPVISRSPSLNRSMLAWGWHAEDRESEGYVMRAARAVAPAEFSSLVGKYVRADHVRTSDDWRHRDDYRLNSWVRV